MCGIAGFLNFESARTADQSVLTRMTDCLIHRGPDAGGFYVRNNVALGHRRLSIIDLNSGGQPMASDDGSVVLIFNGEIYNYIELRSELILIGHRFRTDSDTEVIIKAYQQWGIECQNKFNGVWSLALYDTKTEELFLSRDRIGEKPLYYINTGRAIVFASELESIFKYGIRPEINTDLTELYLYLTYIPTPFTFYKDVFKLRPGHFLRIRGGMVRELKYWDLPLLSGRPLIKNIAEVRRTFSDLFEDSVRIRMRSDVPFGAFLSGGLDSSCVVATMSKMSATPIETFTIGFKERSFDESSLAAKVSRKFNTNHHLHIVNSDTFGNALSKVIKHFGEPFGDSSAIPTDIVSKCASARVKMVLTGDGGDEVLSGYNSYLGLKISENYNRLPKYLRAGIPRILKQLSGITNNRLRYTVNRIVNISETASMSFTERMAHKMAYTDHRTIKKLVSNMSTFPIEDFLSDFFRRYDSADDFYKLMYFDFKHNLPDDYLTKVDRMSMANSIEVRLPFLDHRLIEYMCLVDKEIKLQRWQTKSVLRDTIARQLPRPLLRAKKKGFGVPLREWFKDESFDQRLDELKKMDLLDRAALEKVIEENKSGKNDNGNFIWSLFVMNEFLKRDKDNRSI